MGRAGETTTRRGYAAVPAADELTPNANERRVGGEEENDDERGEEGDRVQLTGGGGSSSDQVDSDSDEHDATAGTTARQQSDSVSTRREEAVAARPQDERAERKEGAEVDTGGGDSNNNNDAEHAAAATSASSDGQEEETEQEETALEPGFIRVRILDLNGKFFNIACQLEWPVLRLKEKVLESAEIPILSQRLIYRGRVLEDEKQLDDYKLEDGHTIHLFVRMNQTPEPELTSGEGSGASTANIGPSLNRFDDGVTIVHITSETISSAVFPSDSARRVDPLMLDSALGNCARRVKLWSSFLLIIYTMKVMGQFALLANDQQMRQEENNKDDTNGQDRYYDRYDYPPYYNQDPMVSAIELMVHAFGVYVGCVGFKAAHDTDIRPIRFYCRGIVWLAILTVAEQIYVTYQISQSDYPETRIQYPYGPAAPSKDDIVSANVFQTVMLVVMWIIAIVHSYAHQAEVARYNESFAAAAMNAVPPAHLPEVV